MSEFICGTDGHEGHWLTGERIVRCRDCKHMHNITSLFGDFVECWLHASPETGALGKTYVEPDGFCKWGERKVDE